MAKCQVYNSHIDRWVLMDDEKKSGFIKCQKQPFDGVPKKNEKARPPESKPENNDSESKPTNKKTKKKSGLLGFFTGS